MPRLPGFRLGSKESKKDEQVSYRGRLRFSHARLTDGGNECEKIKLAILGSPKPTTTRFYLLNRHGNTLQQVRGNECLYECTRNKLRGRKFYLHHQKAEEIEYQRAGGIKDEQNRTIVGALQPGAQFEFDIDFENLAPVELGALLWGLEMDKGMFHRLGYAKPLGFGSVQIIVEGLRQMLPAVRYTQVGTAAGWKECNDKNDYINLFKDSMKNLYGSEFEKLYNILDLRNIFSQANRDLPIHYPRRRPSPDPEGKNFEWFVQNNRRGNHALPLPGEGGLPYL